MGEGILGKLIVQITADLSNLDKGLKEANSKVQSTSTQISENTKKISTAMSVAGVAIVGTFGMMVKSAVAYGDQIYEVSQRTGVATETLSRLKYVAEQTESSFEAVSTGLRFLGRSLYEASKGQNEMKTTFDNLHISVRDTNGNLRKTEEVLMDLADVFSRSTDETAKTAMAMQLLGRGGAQLIPVLNLGSKGIKELSNEADRLGLTLSKDNAVAIDKFSDGMKSAKEAMGGVYLQLSLMLLPTLTKFLVVVRDTIAEVKKWTDQHPKLTEAIVNTTLAMGALLAVLGAFGLAIPAVVRSVALLATTVTGIVATFGGWAVVLPIVGSYLFGLNLGTIMSQIPVVDAFLNKILGVATENRPMRDGKVMTKEDQATFMAENNIGTQDLGRIDVTKGANELADPIAASEKQKAVQQEYADWYKAMQDGLVAVDGNANMQRIAFAQQENQEKMSFLQFYNQEVMRSHAGVYAFLTNISQTFQQGLSSAITGIVTGSMKAKEAFKALGEQMVQAIVSYLAQQLVAWAISKALAGVAHAAAAAMAATLTVAWAPAAFLASVATLGGAVATGTAALSAGMVGAMAMAATSATASSAAGAAGFANGTDTVPAMLTPGEMIMPRSFADAIRAGDLTLGGPSNGQAGGGRQTSIVINYSPVINSELDMDLAAEKLGRLMEEKSRGV